MTDEQIIEALECCITQDGTIPCYSCPCWDYDDEKCKGLSYSDILSLIARQKAEIERYKGVIKILENDISKARSESRKEFAERLKEATCHIVLYGEIVTINTINNLLKEMDGENNA